MVHDFSSHIRILEQRLSGRPHPQTVSLQDLELRWQLQHNLNPVFRHPDLDFARHDDDHRAILGDRALAINALD